MVMELNHQVVFHDDYGMPNLWHCVERTPDKIVLMRRDKCEHCGGGIGISTENGEYWEYCLVCKKEFK